MILAGAQARGAVERLGRLAGLVDCKVVGWQGPLLLVQAVQTSDSGRESLCLLKAQKVPHKGSRPLPGMGYWAERGKTKEPAQRSSAVSFTWCFVVGHDSSPSL